uniref:QRICH1-like domain-containing protein n=1 Tax=Amphimedon queenslandica TaxID=400682 RepID=A0A1X7TE96_AMPQE
MADSSSSIRKGKKSSITLATVGSKRILYYSKDALDVAAQGVVSKKTLCINEWAQKILDRWIQFRATIEDPSEAVPCDLLSCNDPQVLSEWLSKFVMEVRQESGEPYPPRSVQSILFGLYRISRENGIFCNFFR